MADLTPPSSSNPLPSTPSSSSPVPPRKDDADCRNCIGVMVFSEEYMTTGKQPKCYGYKAAKPTSQEQMMALEKRPRLPPSTEVFCIGFSQSTVRMSRLGQPPVLRIGIQLLVSKREIAQLAKKEKQQPEVPKEETKTSWEQYADKIVKRIKAEANPPPSNTASDIPFEYPLNKDLNAFGKNAYKLCSTAVNNFQGVVENPRENINKFRKSLDKLWVAYKRVWARAYNKAFGDKKPDPK